MRDCIRAANLRSSSVMYATMIKTALRTTNAAIIVAGASRPAWTEGGLISVRAGSDTPVLPEVRAGSDTPVLPEVRAGSDTPVLPDVREGSDTPVVPRVVAGSDTPDLPEVRAGSDTPVLPGVRAGSDTPVLPGVRAGSDTPVLPGVRAGSDTPVLPVAEQSSSVDLAEHRVDGAHDRDDVRHLVAGDDVRQHREVREGGAPPLEAIGLRAAVADEVAADLAARAFHPRVAFALRHSHLTDR